MFTKQIGLGILVTAIMLLNACASEESDGTSIDSVPGIDSMVVEKLDILSPDGKTDCLNPDCDSFIVSNVLNNQFNIVIHQGSFDTTFNQARLSVLGRTYSIDSIMYHSPQVPRSTINEIYHYKSHKQEFLLIEATPSFSPGGPPCKRTTVLIQLNNGLPTNAFAFNSITNTDPQISSCLEDIDTIIQPLRINVWSEYEKDVEVFEVDSGRTKLITTKVPQRFDRNR